MEEFVLVYTFCWFDLVYASRCYISPIMNFFTILFSLLCLWFTTYTCKHEHAYKSPHFPPNPCNLFFDISHFELFHLFPSSTLTVSPHLLLFMNSSIRLRPRSSYPPSLFPSVNHGTLILILLAGDVELNPGPSPLNFTHLNIRSIRSFQKSSSLHNYLADHLTEILSQWNMAPTKWFRQFCFIFGTSWLFNLALSSSHWSRWWSCSHCSIIPEIHTFPHSQLTSTWIFRTHGY